MTATSELMPRLAVRNRVQRAYDDALRSGREPDWERFVDDVTALSTRATEDDVATLLALAEVQRRSYRPAAALARVLATYAELEAVRVEALTGLWFLIHHDSAEVRKLVLEATADLGAEERRLFARQLVTDEHPDIRQLAQDLVR